MDENTRLIKCEECPEIGTEGGAYLCITCNKLLCEKCMDSGESENRREQGRRILSTNPPPPDTVPTKRSSELDVIVSKLIGKVENYPVETPFPPSYHNHTYPQHPPMQTPRGRGSHGSHVLKPLLMLGTEIQKEYEKFRYNYGRGNNRGEMEGGYVNSEREIEKKKERLAQTRGIFIEGIRLKTNALGDLEGQLLDIQRHFEFSGEEVQQHLDNLRYYISHGNISSILEKYRGLLAKRMKVLREMEGVKEKSMVILSKENFQDIVRHLNGIIGSMKDEVSEQFARGTMTMSSCSQNTSEVGNPVNPVNPGNPGNPNREMVGNPIESKSKEIIRDKIKGREEVQIPEIPQVHQAVGSGNIVESRVEKMEAQEECIDISEEESLRGENVGNPEIIPDEGSPIHLPQKRESYEYSNNSTTSMRPLPPQTNTHTPVKTETGHKAPYYRESSSYPTKEEDTQQYNHNHNNNNNYIRNPKLPNPGVITHLQNSKLDPRSTISSITYKNTHDDGYPTRRPKHVISGFFMYMKVHEKEYRAKYPHLKRHQYVVYAGQDWKSLSPDQKEPYGDLVRKQSEAYKCEKNRFLQRVKQVNAGPFQKKFSAEKKYSFYRQNKYPLYGRW